MFGLFSKQLEDFVILVDVGNGCITGGLCVFSKNEKPCFYYVTREFFTTEDKIDIKRFESDMINLLDNVILSITKNAWSHNYFKGKRKKISKILISFSSPWFLSKTKAIHLANDKEFVITKGFLDDLIKKEVDELETELKDEMENVELEIVEKSIIHSKINGYILNESIGKNTKKFDASLYLSVVGKNFIHKIFDNLHKHTHISFQKILFHTFPLVLFSVVRDNFTTNSSFLLMDVTGEITDITLVKDDMIEKTVSMPSGRNFILRQLSKKLSVTYEITESTLRLYSVGKLTEDMNSKVSEVLNEIEKEWAIYFENAILELAPDGKLPQEIFLTADNDMAHIFVEFLKIQKLDATATLRKQLKLNYLDIEKLKTFFDNKSGFILDEFIVILAIFYKKLLIN